MRDKGDGGEQNCRLFEIDVIKYNDKKMTYLYARKIEAIGLLDVGNESMTRKMCTVGSSIRTQLSASSGRFDIKAPHLAAQYLLQGKAFNNFFRALHSNPRCHLEHP